MTKKTRYFMAGSGAILIAGLGTGLIAFYSGGFPTLLANQGPTELAYVPANASVVAFANVRQIMDSPVRQHLKLALPNENGQKEFQSETGIDIERDVDYVVAAMTPPGPDGLPKNANGLVVARGVFNGAQLEALATSHGGTVEEYRGKRLVTIHDDNTQADHSHTGVLAFLEPNSLIAVGSETAVKSAIDAQLSAQSITTNGDMMDLVSDISRANNAWAVGRFDAIASQAKLPAEIASKIPAIKTFAVSTEIDGGISGTFRADARDQQSADNLRQVIQGLMALGRLQNDPKSMALLNSLQLSGSGNTVSLSFVVPQELIDMIPIKGVTGGGQQFDMKHLHELPKELHERR